MSSLGDNITPLCNFALILTFCQFMSSLAHRCSCNGNWPILIEWDGRPTTISMITHCHVRNSL